MEAGRIEACDLARSASAPNTRNRPTRRFFRSSRSPTPRWIFANQRAPAYSNSKVRRLGRSRCTRPARASSQAIGSASSRRHAKASLAASMRQAMRAAPRPPRAPRRCGDAVPRSPALRPTASRHCGVPPGQRALPGSPFPGGASTARGPRTRRRPLRRTRHSRTQRYTHDRRSAASASTITVPVFSARWVQQQIAGREQPARRRGPAGGARTHLGDAQPAQRRASCAPTAINCASSRAPPGTGRRPCARSPIRSRAARADAGPDRARHTLAREPARAPAQRAARAFDPCETRREFDEAIRRRPVMALEQRALARIYEQDPVADPGPHSAARARDRSGPRQHARPDGSLRVAARDRDPP